MNIEDFNEKRSNLNELMKQNDNFFDIFGKLDDQVYAQGVIPKKYKELTGLSISVISRCEECILYHIQGCLNEGASKEEMIEAIKLGVIGGGSIVYPSARFAFNMLRDMSIL